MTRHATNEPTFSEDSHALEFAEQVRANQLRLTAELKLTYDFIICGSGSSGSVVARRLAENPKVSVLLLEAGGQDDIPNIVDPRQWATNLGSDRDWGFQAQSNPELNGRAIGMSMGKVLGGGSSINVLHWVRGHRSDWNHFADEAGDAAWNYESVLKLYRRIEDWHGEPDAEYRSNGGAIFIKPSRSESPLSLATFEAARSIGVPPFGNLNGRMMEGEGGCSYTERAIRNGKRQSVFRAYVFPYMDRPNLTVLTRALVTRITFDHNRASGVEVAHNGKLYHIGAGLEVVLSLGAIQTPKVLMQSGIGDQAELQRFGIPLVQHLPGVGQNFQDHTLIMGCVWEHQQPDHIHTSDEVILQWKSDPRLDSPDMQCVLLDQPAVGRETAKFSPPTNSWTIVPGLVRPKSRGRLRLTGPNHLDPVEIYANHLNAPADLTALTRAVEFSCDLANSAALRPFAKRQVIPGDPTKQGLEDFVRSSASTYWHQTCTAKMGRDSMSVVDGNLKVYGIKGLRIADGSIMPRITTGNTMAPCVVIGERAGEILKSEYKL
ncbi:GMC family oxidoreductase [Granulicella sp. WH15]|uniref:GMC family oxidoreductase n=1 Tax=Granulicella sp. WH15 TaxID=2602070 RepID=UPI00136760EE|nr:GMC family oxidoreductase N-terminal domain-containing protein [Granulicella sp. WH15]QHN03669.1 GMC family oxidoreductase [Granulicella sp. WH15]